MHFHNLHSENQDVSASSQQLHESCFLVRLARKQQFISRGTWGLKTRPSEHKKGILTKSKPRGTTHRQPPSREMAAHARQPLQSSPGHMVQQRGCPEPWGSCTPPDSAAACILLLSFTVTSALGKVPSHCWDATCQLPACAFPVLPSSPFPSHHLQWHNSLDPPQAQHFQLTPSWPKNNLVPVTSSWDYSHCSRVGRAWAGWAGAVTCGALRAPEVATTEMMQCRAMHSPHYQQMKGETVVNITFAGFTHCMKAITHAPIISFTLFFAGDENKSLQTASITLLKGSIDKPPMSEFESLST